MPIARPSRPPMGWNTWDCYGHTVTEAEVMSNAEFMVEHLLPLGWDTIVLDAAWFGPMDRPAPGPDCMFEMDMDEFGRHIPNPARFPSSVGANGFEPLATRLHEMGLRFGLHVMRGIPRPAVEQNLPILGTDLTAEDIVDRENLCEWSGDNFGLDFATPGAQAYYDSTVALMASWGIDFLKFDDAIGPFQEPDVRAFAAAVEKCDREMVISLSPGREMSLSRLAQVREYGSMWRICNDLWDNWDSVKANLPRFARWAPHQQEGAWPDGDMLPLGRIGIRAEQGSDRDDALTPAQRRFLVTLWLLARSPLMIGGDLPRTEASTMALFTNADAMAVHRDGRNPQETLREGSLVAWTSEGVNGEKFAALLNAGDEQLDQWLELGQIGFPVDGGTIRELWTGSEVPVQHIAERNAKSYALIQGASVIDLRIPPHDAMLLRWTA